MKLFNTMSRTNSRENGRDELGSGLIHCWRLSSILTDGLRFENQSPTLKSQLLAVRDRFSHYFDGLVDAPRITDQLDVFVRHNTNIFFFDFWIADAEEL